MKRTLQEITETYKSLPSDIYSAKFFKNRLKWINKQLLIGQYLVQEYKIESIVDFGCALGGYLLGALKSGAKVVRGFEYLFDNAKKYLPKDIAEYISYGNVMEDITCGKFDCSMSVEVAEHILPEKSDVFVNNLVNSSNKYIFLTAAFPGQGGTGHINEQPRKIWIKRFETKGFKYSQECVDKNNRSFKILSKKTPDYMYRHMFFIKDK